MFAFCKLLSLKKRLLKFDQELSARWKKATVYAIGYQHTGRFFLAKFRKSVLEAEALEAEAIGVEAVAVYKYTASTSLIKIRFDF